MKRTILLLLIVLLSFGAGMGIWYLRAHTGSAPIVNKRNTATTSKKNAVSTSATTNNASTIETKPPASQPVDTDHDGLTDDEEKQLGTDPRKADSDGDGLTDRQEARVYRTDPLKADTDGDGIDDGAEVRAGANPNGNGKLLDLQQELNKH